VYQVMHKGNKSIEYQILIYFVLYQKKKISLPCILMLENTHRYFALHKPINMVSQFISSHDVNLLGSIDFDFPEGTHAIGRLDNGSEGLLLLTTNKKITKLLFQSKQLHQRTYIVQVANQVSATALQTLQNGVSIRIKGDVYWTTTPCQVQIIDAPIAYAKPEIGDRKIGPHTWLRIILTEGKFHQVRKMVFAVRHKCKRLIRESIEDLLLADLPIGAVKEYSEENFFRLLKLEKIEID
jgi:23S rRNA pseudouridine2457 synthase